MTYGVGKGLAAKDGKRFLNLFIIIVKARLTDGVLYPE